MTDLELTKLCAQAMGYTRLSDHFGGLPMFAHETGVYDPLHDDAQAMALVKKFRIGVNAWNPEYQVWIQGKMVSPKESGKSCTFNANLNRAICECVAKMQKARI